MQFKLSAADIEAARFNEAGADCPGMPFLRFEQFHSVRQGFNEAGADCPGMHCMTASPLTPIPRFNEAGADCPGMRSRQRNYFREARLLQ